MRTNSLLVMICLGSVAGIAQESAPTPREDVGFKVTNHIAFKPVQVEYLTAQLPDLVASRSSFQNNLRYSAGVVFRFGEK